jgi:hypothetical protein
LVREVTSIINKTPFRESASQFIADGKRIVVSKVEGHCDLKREKDSATKLPVKSHTPEWAKIGGNGLRLFSNGNPTRAWKVAGWTLRRIATSLNGNGIANKRAGANWYASTVSNVLRNHSTARPVAA